jgi:hypothetical protein
MAGRFNRLWRWLAALPAALAVLAQLAFASWGLVLLDAASGPVDGFDPHALCRAADKSSSNPGAPGQQAPAGSTHTHLAFCCLGHQLPGVERVLAQICEPVGYVPIARVETKLALFITVAPQGPAKARAPPTLA